MSNTDVKVICIYHKIDFDGKSAGALVRLYYERLGIPVTLFGMDYGDIFDYELIDKNTIVVMVDFTFCIQGEQECIKAWPMFKIQDMAKQFIWLDHHGSSIADVDAYTSTDVTITTPFDGIRDTKFSGTELTWLYFFNQVPYGSITAQYTDKAFAIEIDGIDVSCLTPECEEYMERVPRIIYLLGRYDVWNLQHRDWQHLVDFQFGFRLFGDMKPENDDSFAHWRALIEDPHSMISDVETTVALEGSIVLKYLAIDNIDYICRHGYACELLIPSDKKDEAPTPSPLTFFAMNTGNKGSGMFESLKGQYDGFIAYKHDGTRWNVSIYSFDTERCHAQTICRRLGGGGHPGAAGFVWSEVKELPFRKV